jgi:KipI family sensor histidine kinase inhibitor
VSIRTVQVGRHALLVEVASTEEATRLYADLRSTGLEVEDLVPAARTVLLDGVADHDAVRVFLETWSPVTTGAGPGRVVEVPTTYDGDDLDDVARSWDMTRAEVVATHTATEHVVAFCGFAPGFAYCTGLPQHLHVPRLERPRTRVPAGSVGLAGEYTGIYPTSSPGGWRLLGTTDLALWDATAEPPATLSPGTRVRFTEVRG